MTDLITRAREGFSPTQLEIELADEVERLRDAAKGSTVIVNQAIKDRTILTVACSRAERWCNGIPGGEAMRDELRKALEKVGAR